MTLWGSLRRTKRVWELQRRWKETLAAVREAMCGRDPERWNSVVEKGELQHLFCILAFQLNFSPLNKSPKSMGSYPAHSGCSSPQDPLSAAPQHKDDVRYHRLPAHVSKAKLVSFQ